MNNKADITTNVGIYTDYGCVDYWGTCYASAFVT